MPPCNSRFVHHLHLTFACPFGGSSRRALSTRTPCTLSLRVKPLQTRLPVRSLAPRVRSCGGLSINWGLPLRAEGPVTPVTLISGFLGAGKTTLLKKILENRRGLRVGVVVNDVAAVNVDAQLIAKAACAEGVEVAELQNGCVCCSLADDLLISVAEVLSRAPAGAAFDHLIIELSGVSEPEAIKQNWAMAAELGHPAATRSRIARVVTLVDASCFSVDWLDSRSATERNEKFDDTASQRSIVRLLAEQIETADAVLLNKIDLADPAELRAAEQVITSVNADAELLSCSFGEVALDRLLPSEASQQSRPVTPLKATPTHSTCSEDSHGHGHGHSHSHTHSPSPQEKYGIHSFVYEARRPFSAIRFLAFTKQLHEEHPLKSAESSLVAHDKGLAGLLRAKGVCWLDNEPFTEHTWHFVGKSSSLEQGDPWWAACSEEHLRWRVAYPGFQAIYDKMRRVAWDEVGEWGDRRQELVFIGGPEMIEETLRQGLDNCLITETEMETFREANLGKHAEFELELGPGVSP